MYAFILYFIVIVTCYIITFKNDFENEKIEEAVPYAIGAVGVFILIGLFI